MRSLFLSLVFTACADRSAPEFIETWNQTYFQDGQEDAWKQWVDAEPRGPEQVGWLVRSDQNIAIRRRALFVLLTPNLDWVPFYWEPRSFVGSDGVTYRSYTYNSCLDVEDPELYAFGTESLYAFVDAIDKDGYEHASDDLKYWRGVHNFLFLCEMRSEDQVIANRAFDHFLMDDPSDPGHYHWPWFALIDQWLSEGWKRKIDLKMRALVEADITVLPAYITLVSSAFDMGQRYNPEAYPYSQELYDDQMRFIEKMKNPD